MTSPHSVNEDAGQNGRSKRFNTAIRFPPELHAALEQAARERDLSINWLVNRAVEDFLSRLVPANEIKLTR